MPGVALREVKRPWFVTCVAYGFAYFCWLPSVRSYDYEIDEAGIPILWEPQNGIIVQSRWRQKDPWRDE